MISSRCFRSSTGSSSSSDVFESTVPETELLLLVLLLLLLLLLLLVLLLPDLLRLLLRLAVLLPPTVLFPWRLAVLRLWLELELPSSASLWFPDTTVLIWLRLCRLLLVDEILVSTGLPTVPPIVGVLDFDFR
jgi:hypothetical protein